MAVQNIDVMKLRESIKMLYVKKWG